jgi:hypothetical protein
MWIVKDVSGSFQDQFDVLYGLEQMIQDDVLTKFEVPSDWNRCGIMLCKPNLKCYVDLN